MKRMNTVLKHISRIKFRFDIQLTSLNNNKIRGWRKEEAEVKKEAWSSVLTMASLNEWSNITTSIIIMIINQ